MPATSKHNPPPYTHTHSVIFLINPSRLMMYKAGISTLFFFFLPTLSTILVWACHPALRWLQKSISFSRMLLSPRGYIQIPSTLDKISCANKMVEHLETVWAALEIHGCSAQRRSSATIMFYQLSVIPGSFTCHQFCSLDQPQVPNYQQEMSQE